MFLQSGEEKAEKGRPEEHTGDHLADDLRLYDAPCECADNAADGQNNEHLQEKGNGELGTSHDVRAE